MAGVSALVLVAVAGGLIARAIITSRPAPQSHTPPTTQIFNPGDSRFSCPKDASWSPNGATIALLGYQSGCPSNTPDAYQYRTGLIVLYDTATGKVTQTIHPDALISDALHLKTPTIATPIPYQYPLDTSHQVIDYAHVLWSPDGKRLAVTFSALIATAEPTNHDFVTSSLQGVLLLSPSGTGARVLSHSLGQSSWHCLRSFGGGLCQQQFSQDLGKYEWYSGLWNLSTGDYMAPGAPVALPTPDMSWFATRALLPPAPAYQWDGAGHLQAASAPTSAGQSDGGKSFSVWQPGVALLLTQMYPDDPSQSPQPLQTPVEIWDSSFAAWSADGTYLLADSGVNGWRIAVPGQQAPDEATLAKVGLADAPVLQPRDAATTSALQSYHDLSQNPDGANTLIYMAWSPDGKRLAVETPPNGLNSRHAQLSDYAVRIYDCASGKLLGVITPNVTLNGEFGGQALLRWSPDSSHLLLYHPLLSGAQIWGPGELPKA